jgi:hypothetical protein
MEVESSIKVNGSTAKNSLINSPFLIFCEYGAGVKKEGYWTDDHMALQFKDCISCIQALHPEFDTVWIFDRSCGCDRGRTDGLLVGNMRTNWGGKQSRVRDTLIKEEVEYLGPCAPALKAGDNQKIGFQEDDEGPYYMSIMNRQLHRYDAVKGKKIKNV